MFFPCSYRKILEIAHVLYLHFFFCVLFSVHKNSMVSIQFFESSSRFLTLTVSTIRLNNYQSNTFKTVLLLFGTYDFCIACSFAKLCLSCLVWFLCLRYQIQSSTCITFFINFLIIRNLISDSKTFW